MTLLVGQNGTGWTFVGTDGISSQQAKYQRVGYVAVGSGTMSTANVNVFGVGTATAATIYVYQGGGPGAILIATSAAIDLTATGIRSAAISGNIVANTTYTLVYQRSTVASCQDTGNSGSNVFACNQNNASDFPYGAAPIALPAADLNNGQEFVVWIDGVITSDPLSSQICL